MRLFFIITQMSVLSDLFQVKYKIKKWHYISDGIGSIYYMPISNIKLCLIYIILRFLMIKPSFPPFNFLFSYNVYSYFVNKSFQFHKSNFFDFYNLEKEYNIVLFGNTDIDYEIVIADLDLNKFQNKFFVPHHILKNMNIKNFKNISLNESFRLIKKNKNKILCITEVSTLIDKLKSLNSKVVISRRNADFVDYQMNYYTAKKFSKCDNYSYYII